MENIKSRLYSALQRIWWFIHIRFPNVTRSPYGTRRNEKLSDSVANQETRLSPEDNVRLTGIWAVEMYSFSEMESLYEGMRKLGWHKNPYGSLSHLPIKWIRDQRMYGHGGSFNVGSIFRSGAGYVTPHSFTAPIPREFHHLTVSVHQLTKSLTCVVVGFVVDPKYASIYEAEINKDRRTVRRRQSGVNGYSVIDVRALKTEAIHSVRAFYRAEAVKWFRSNLPGFFSKIGREDRFPTMELVLSENEVSFPHADGRLYNHSPQWIRFLQFESAREVWINSKLNSLRIGQSINEELLRNHFLAAFSRSERQLLKLENDHRDFDSDVEVTAFLNDQLGKILLHHAGVAYLADIKRELVEYREMISTTRGRKSVLKLLEKLEVFFAQSIGVRSVAAELLEASKHPFHFYEIANTFFCRENWNRKETIVQIDDALRSSTKSYASEVMADESATRQLFEQLSSIMSTRENIKAQGKMERLTWLTIMLAVISVVMAYLALKQP